MSANRPITLARKRVVPGTYFFRGESAPVQLRNSARFSVLDGKLVLAGRAGEVSGISDHGSDRVRKPYCFFSALASDLASALPSATA